ncbi:hypothetical protein O181_041026 [Austropuccinia psidii MF-1]|uniref:Uncharacterized protein n=1 Tax=Austropuccinia psidii MF-1 TaxID=1389203 RepID=A0A9Q3HDX2_9BASI|nr:hypothetical protein [Austropuccinia psidii MF-1]
MSPVHLRSLAFQRNQPEDRKGLSRARRHGGGHVGHSGGWQDIEGYHTHPDIQKLIQQKPQTRGLEGYGSSSSAPPIPQSPFQWSMDNNRFNVASHWEELGASCKKICLKEIDFKDLMVITKGRNPTRQFRFLEVRENRMKGESSHYPSYRRTADPDRA